MESKTFLLSDYPELLTKVLEDNRIRRITIMDPDATLEDVEALVTCPRMNNAVRAAIFVPWQKQGCRACTNKVTYYAGKLEFDRICPTEE